MVWVARAVFLEPRRYAIDDTPAYRERVGPLATINIPETRILWSADARTLIALRFERARTRAFSTTRRVCMPGHVSATSKDTVKAVNSPQKKV